MHVSTSKISAKRKEKLCKSDFASLTVAKEKQVTTKQAFPFHACFNEQNFCEAEREALQERYLRV